MGNLQVEGRENFPATGPYLVVVNHLHWLDVPLVMVTLRHHAAGIAAYEWGRHPVVGRLGRRLGHVIFVRRGTDHRALVEAIGWLRGGGVLGLAPEGARSQTGALRRGRRGAAYLASRTGVPVVPVAAWGQERILADLKRLHRPRIHVRIGTPFLLPGTPSRAKDDELDAHTDRIMRAIAVLLPPEYRGVYGQPPGAPGGQGRGRGP
jgi:1-acyl-sn-glycerol-3-phosphate acyltransferase